MDKFTVKDFIKHNAPCFSCGKDIGFQIGFYDTIRKDDVGYLRPTVTPEHTEINLKITYSDAIKLYIFHKDNKILTNNEKGLTEYLERYKLFLSSICAKCSTRIVSQNLSFNLEKMFVEPVEIKTETLSVVNKDTTYIVDSFFDEQKSFVYIFKKDKSTKLDIKLELSLLPKSKFKDKKAFIDKMKFIILYS
jgi:hypothetical protein